MEKPADIPQLAIIFNNATGMKYTLLESKAAINAFDEKLQQQILPQTDIDYMDRQPNRSVAAKELIFKSLSKNSILVYGFLKRLLSKF